MLKFLRISSAFGTAFLPLDKHVGLTKENVSHGF